MQFLKAVGPARARALARLGIDTVGDLLAHYPRRYFDRTSARAHPAACRPGQDVTVLGEVLTCGERRTRRGGSLLTVTLGDDTGVLFCVWFNQKFLAEAVPARARRSWPAAWSRCTRGGRSWPTPISRSSSRAATTTAARACTPAVWCPSTA